MSSNSRSKSGKPSSSGHTQKEKPLRMPVNPKRTMEASVFVSPKGKRPKQDDKDRENEGAGHLVSLPAKDATYVALASSPTAQGEAMQATNSISKLVEALVRCRDSEPDGYTEKAKQAIQKWLKRNTIFTDQPRLFGLFQQLQLLIPIEEKGERKDSPQVLVAGEREMYEPAKALIGFISECIRLQTKLKAQPQRLIEPFEKVDNTPVDSEYSWRIDIAMRCRSMSDTSLSPPTSGHSAVKEPKQRLSRPNVANTFAYIELKRHVKDTNEAYAQLFRYTKEIYATQHNRRFAWGMIMCNTIVNACVFEPNYAAASENMDLATAAGRKDLIRLFVNWSFCDSCKLGYDPAISYDDSSQCLVIQPEPTAGNPAMALYSREVLVCAEQMFGRHTRCFAVSANKPPPPDPGDKQRKPHQQMKCDTIVKDSWVEAPEDPAEDTRDEARHLSVITERLQNVNSVGGMYPRLRDDCKSGRVHLADPVTGNLYEDTSNTVLGDAVWSQLGKTSTALHVFKRIYMNDIGTPIKYARNVQELIIVAADVMRCHWQIVKECSILHRDVSLSNMLVCRDDDGSVHGMLIDFDHAVDIDATEGSRHAERTGTLQFMSVNNLARSHPRQTALDDWESMLYILCWAGTYGWSSQTRRDNTGRLGQPTLLKSWYTGLSHEELAEAKRNILHSEDLFNQVIMQFNYGLQGIMVLIKLVMQLRKVLIETYDDDRRGAMEVGEFQLNPDTNKPEYVIISDPFEKRSAMWEELSPLLLQTLEEYAQQAKAQLDPTSLPI
ncbi:hypothetical protein H4S06_001292 [Coemansia sp. BCRC 34490]|nr:hypothetical protein H4S06_001292 [Coemansia sp. BCRC 34490]